MTTETYTTYYPSRILLNAKKSGNIGVNVTNQVLRDTKVSTTNQRTGVGKPGWRWKIRNHISATTSLTGTEVETDHVDCEAGYWFQDGSNPLGYYAQSGQLSYQNSAPALDVALVASARNAASQQFYSKATKALSPVSGAIALAELRETVHLIRNPLKSLREGVTGFYNAAKERCLKAPKRHRDRLASDTWLEYSFGWAPLISDVQDGAKAASRIANDFHRSIMVKARSNFTKSNAGVLGTIGVSQSGLEYRPICVDTFSADVTYLAEIGLTVHNFPQSLVDLGLAPWSVVPAVWEAIPWSFMVDYFLNVGSMLTALNFPSSQIRWCNFSERQGSYRRINGMWVNEAWAKTTVGASRYRGCWVTGKMTGVLRRKSVLRSSAVPEWPSPNLEMVSGVTKFLNIGALLNMKRRPW